MARATEPTARLPAILTLGAILAAAYSDAPAQDSKSGSNDHARHLQQQFRAERKQSVDSGAASKFSPQMLERADNLARQADATLDAGQSDHAARLYRDARWLLPALPAEFPDHVARVFGDPRLRHGDRVTALAYSPDGRLLATASRDGTVRLWDVGNGREARVYRGHGGEPVQAVAFAPGGRAVASSAGKEVRLWEVETGKDIRTL